MKRKIFFTILFTFSLTTIFWGVVMLLSEKEPAPTDLYEIPEEVTLDGAEDVEVVPAGETGEDVPESSYPTAIIGTWAPVDVSNYTLEISRYGTLSIKAAKTGVYPPKESYRYTIDGKRLGYTFLDQFFSDDFHRIHIYTLEGITYLDFYEDTRLGGMYKKVK